MPTTPCLPRETLKQYLSGWSDPESSDAIEAHLLQCIASEQTVVDLECRPDTLCDLVHTSARRDSGESIEASDDPAVQYALARAKRVPISAPEVACPWQPETTQVGPYTLLRSLGHGGMGAVYLARHNQLGKQVAIKLLPARSFRNDHYAARFQREIQPLAVPAGHP